MKIELKKENGEIKTIQEIEREYFSVVYNEFRETKYNYELARLMGFSYADYYRKLRRFNIETKRRKITYDI